jgi:hypothetical protein
MFVLQAASGGFGNKKAARLWEAGRWYFCFRVFTITTLLPGSQE